jgi:hypothetical protein
VITVRVVPEGGGGGGGDGAFAVVVWPEVVVGL